MARVLLAAVLVLYGGWLAVDYHYHFLDGVNLLFHEAGHVFFGMFGWQTLAILGGTLGQLVFPIACGVHFAVRGAVQEAAACGVWLGENLLYVAVYIDDARVQVLPRVGGEIHDWNWLLTRWGCLLQCEAIARVVHVAGVAIILAGVAVAVREALRALHQPDPSGAA
jgi:hypothetical protein